MVGVPGRSKGCKTCRRRKKGCDLRRPFCGQCLRGGYICEGYAREISFINLGVDGSSLKSTRVKAKLPVPNSQITLQRSALRTQCLSLFWDTYLPHGENDAAVLVGSNSHFSADCLRLISQLQRPQTALSAAFSALVMARLGRINQDLSLTHSSYRLHSTSLSELQTAVRDKNKMLNDETVATVMLLGLYEIFEGSHKRGFGWTSHIQGASRLFELRSPDFHESDACRSLFLGFRLTGIIHAVGTRKPTYLASPEWTNKPWEGFQKSPEDKLLDIMAILPSMMEEADSIRSQTQASSERSVMMTLARRCRSLIYELERWHRLWTPTSARTHWLQPSEIYKEVGPNQGIPMAIYFIDLETAHLENLYWASLLLIHATFWVSYEWVKTQSPLSSDLAENGESELSDHGAFPACSCLQTLAPLSEIHTYAMNIVQSLEYFLQPKLGASGSSLIGFPLTVAMGYFEYFQLPELSWFKIILGRFQRLGIPLEQFLDGMANEAVATLVRE